MEWVVITGILLVFIVGDWIFFCVGDPVPHKPPGSIGESASAYDLK